MGRVMAFNSQSLDGYFTDANNNIDWAHAAGNDEEFNEFVAGNAKGDGILLMGRVTYDMMVSYWPTDQAKQQMPEVAEGMNRMPKVVFSRTMKSSPWQNTTVVNDDPADHVRRLKQESDDNMVILGSGSIVTQLTHGGLIDDYQIVLIPIVLGGGRTMFGDADVKLELTDTRRFRNGNVLLSYVANV
jgi:dihydrofolate reductase